MTALMVQGTSSWAGKSLLVTALARHFARRGMRVAPFKGQNMSNNARVAAGGEIGTAQWLQARAARVEPDVRMNPILVKPEGDTRSQVVVNGRVDRELSALPWRARGGALWPAVAGALRALLEEFELVLVEGAGSPAEVNLVDSDLANMPVARAADAAVLLVADIHRGGAFAHLYGTWGLLEPADRARLRGFVLNRFRGDPALLAPGPERLAALTGVPTVGVVPWLDHELPDEDGAATPRSGTGPRVAVVRYPTASNLDELKPLEQVARVRWARSPGDLEAAELVILPGSKHVAADLAWLQDSGVGAAVARRAAAGGPVLGICGGAQLLGAELRDAGGVDGDGRGLGLLPLRTTFAAEKTVRRTATRFAALDPPWGALSQRAVAGYEIRHGHTTAFAPVAEALPGGLGWVDGPILGVVLHGLLEDPALVGDLLGVAPPRGLDAALDDLADGVGAHLDLDRIDALAGCP